jgi:hypothetical protein
LILLCYDFSEVNVYTTKTSKILGLWG